MFGRDSRVSELEQALNKLKTDFERLEFEWIQTRHSLKKLAGRLAKSEALEQAREEPRAEAPPLEVPNGQGGLLNDRQRNIQQQILRRRAGMH